MLFLLLKMSDMLRVKTEVLLRKKKKKWFLWNQDTVTSSAQKSVLPAEAGGVTTRAGRPGAQPGQGWDGKVQELQGH